MFLSIANLIATNQHCPLMVGIGGFHPKSVLANCDLGQSQTKQYGQSPFQGDG